MQKERKRKNFKKLKCVLRNHCDDILVKHTKIKEGQTKLFEFFVQAFELLYFGF